MTKLIFQNEFGPGHMIASEDDSFQYLKKEWAHLPHSSFQYLSSASFTDIGNHLTRVQIADCQPENLPALNNLFFHTANTHEGNVTSLEEKLELLISFCEKETLYSFRNSTNFLENYRQNGYPAISHSEQYRNAYHPAYRVIKKSFASYLLLLKTIQTKLSTKENLVIAIDGNCAAGKTFLSIFLSSFLDCNVIHMDDFFLPPALRSTERLESPGGNIHYERFFSEVVKPILFKQPVSYRRFSCKSMDYQDTVTLPKKPLTIVEGSYSMREEFRTIYDYTIFLSCPYEEQLRRIRMRNGEDMLPAFMDKWIPMENIYFEAFKIQKLCDEIIFGD